MTKVANIVFQSPKILIYSGPGTGKTALTLTLGEGLQILDLDRGLLTAIHLKDKWTEERQKVDAIQYYEEKPWLRATVFRKVKSKIIDIANQCNSGKYPFEAFALDSISALGEAALASVMDASSLLGKQPQIQHWGLAISEVKQVISILACLPIPVIVIGHEQIKTLSAPSGLTTEDRIQLSIYGRNLPVQLPGFFDEFWRMRAKPIGGGKYQYLLQTRNTGLAEAKSRSCLPNNLDVECGMWAILEKLGYHRQKEQTTK